MKRFHPFVWVLVVACTLIFFGGCKDTEQKIPPDRRTPQQTSPQPDDPEKQPETKQPQITPPEQDSEGSKGSGGSAAGDSESSGGTEAEADGKGGNNGTGDSVRSRIEEVRKRLDGTESPEGSERLSELKARAAGALNEAEQLGELAKTEGAQTDTALRKVDEAGKALDEFDHLLPQYKKVKELLKKVENAAETAKNKGIASKNLEALKNEVEKNLENDYDESTRTLQEILDEYEKLLKEKPSENDAEQKDSPDDDAAQAKADAEDACEEMDKAKSSALEARTKVGEYEKDWPADWEKGEAKLKEAMETEGNARKAGQLYGEAEGLFRHIVEQQVNWLIERAKAEKAAGNSEKATSLLQEALELDPDNKEVQGLLGTLPRIPEGCEWIPEKGTRKDGKRGTYNWEGVLYPTAIRHKASGIELVLIPPGEYTMGSPADVKEGDADEVPHKVKISKPFYLGRTEVTQKQYKAIRGKNPSRFIGENLPVEKVTWHDASAFCKALGEGFRLPTEAEWEYACRAGSQSRWFFGDDEKELGRHAWYKDNSDEKTHDVATKLPNKFGLYDMHGNVWEWCRDWYGDYAEGEQENPQGPEEGTKRILRGGCWISNANPTRLAYRYRNEPLTEVDFNGFRVARPVD